MSFGAEQSLVLVIGVADRELLRELRVGHQMPMMGRVPRIDGKGRVADPLAVRVDAVAGDAAGQGDQRDKRRHDQPPHRLPFGSSVEE
jgi:hypothetical protein